MYTLYIYKNVHKSFPYKSKYPEESASKYLSPSCIFALRCSISMVHSHLLSICRIHFGTIHSQTTMTFDLTAFHLLFQIYCNSLFYFDCPPCHASQRSCRKHGVMFRFHCNWKDFYFMGFVYFIFQLKKHKKTKENGTKSRKLFP